MFKQLKEISLVILMCFCVLALAGPAMAAVAVMEDGVYAGEATAINVSAGGPEMSGSGSTKTLDFSRGSTKSINKIHQQSTTAAKYVLEMEQDDVDVAFMSFSGDTNINGLTNIYQSTATAGAKWGSIKVSIDTDDDGVADADKWIRVYDNGN